MPYDDERYENRHILGPVFGSFASALKSTSAIKYKQPENDCRIDFFKKVKLTGLKALVKTAPDALAHATPAVKLYLGTAATDTGVGSASLGTVASVTVNGAINLSTFASDVSLYANVGFTGDGTAMTLDKVSVNVYLEYQYPYFS